MVEDTMTRTLFDEVATREGLTQATRYIILAASTVETAQGSHYHSQMLINLKRFEEFSILGIFFGEMLRHQYGHEDGSAILAAIFSSAKDALQQEEQ